MMKLQRTARTLIAGSLALLMLAGCGSPKLDEAPKSTPASGATAKPPIKLGLTISLSGGTADMGEAARDGAQLALKEINEKGGVNGQQLELIVYDDETKPEKGLENAKRLIDQDKVAAFLGPANTGVGLNQVDYVQQSQVLMLVTASAGTAVTQKFKDQDKNYILRTSMVDAAQAPTMVDFLVKNKGLKKIAILHDTTAYGVGGKDDMIKRLKEKWDLAPVAVESFKIGDTDLSAQIERAKAAGAEAVATYALGPELAQVMKALARANWKVPVVGSWTITGELFHKLAADLVENDVYGVMSVHPSKSEAYKAFDEKMRKAYGRNNFAPVAAQSYDGIYILAKAIEKAGTDPKAIRDAVEATTGFSGVTNTPAQPWGKGKPEALTLKDMFIGRWTNGTMVPVPDSTVTQ